MTIKTLEDLFIHDLSDVYSAEKQITRALPKMARAATDEKLVAAFHEHLEETRGQIERLDQLVEATEGVRIKRMKCHALEGLAEEAQEIIDSVEAGPVRDAGLIGAAQKVEHYEIAAYGTLQALALKLGYKNAARLLGETLDEEKSTDEKLTVIAGQQS
ncbi:MULTISPECIES: YciE/YciF ferroxidase family protein [Erwinia]|jgi:ferritin-like metal-binding protein YciE|uniref:YciE/YciF ferroxidase family protein n=1 Tax=Erwinia TaxID=551 RepID=UPI0010714297|nr:MULTISPECIES: ferritin-like domain-containing protein [Erwinia]MCX0498299.1 ferritin-like domain-containing protein [Erwinia billingiae]QBR48575.1 ferritin-like domain-containing protein [Erwinia sp. QL-Z3]